MRAAVLTNFNQPWELKDVPDPKPAAGQVLIRIRACGLCGTDLHVHHGHLGGKPPLICGHEPVGEISALGEGVTDYRVGDRVGVYWNQKGCGRCEYCQQGRSLFCSQGQTWMHLGGGHAEQMLAWASGCVLLPPQLAYEDAAPLFCAGFTVISGLRQAAPRPGEVVAVLGVGGLGHLAVQISKALGFPTVAVTGTPSKAEELKKLGADEVVTGEDLGKALLARGGADVVLSTTNSAKQVAQTLAGLKAEGRFVNMGISGEPVSFDLGVLMWRQASLIGGSQGSRRDMVELLDLAAKGKVKPMTEVYPLAQVNEVRERLEQGKVRYRAVLLPGHA